MMAGQYNEIVKVFRIEETENDYGERESEQIYVTTTRAKVESTTGTRSNENNEIVYDYTKTFYVRSYIPITDTSIIEFDNKKYRIITFDKRRDHNDIKIITELINE